MTTISRFLTPLTPSGERPVDLLVIGDTGIDLMVHVGSLPGKDAKSIGPSRGIHPGGMGANFASAASSSHPDLKVSLISRVGSDAFGAGCLQALSDAGVDTSRIDVMADELTWWCAVAIDADGEKALLGGRTKASLPESGQVSTEDLAQSRWLHVLADVPGSDELVLAATAAGTVTSVDIEGSFVADDEARARRLIDTAHVTVLNSGAAKALTGCQDDHHSLQRLLDERPGRVIVLTRGTAGSMLGAIDPHEGRLHVWRQPSIHVPVVIDTTGAGDAFAGTLVASLLADREIPASLDAAARAAATAITHFGSRPGGVPGWPQPTKETQGGNPA